MAAQKASLARTFFFASALRLGLVFWSVYQDAHFDVKYTDIDYFVYTDAARHVVNGGSPYERATYRYPPILAVILTPNVLLHEAFGKIIFSCLDIAVGVLICNIVRRRGFGERSAQLAAWTWLFNPFTCTISTRGSCEALTAVLMLYCVDALTRGATAQAALAYGTVVHFRLYPIIHVPAFVAFLNADYIGNRRLFGERVMPKMLSWVTVENVKFGVVSACTFLGLTWGSFKVYGMDYVNEAMLYHTNREDHRHNFSPLFYSLYLDGHSSRDIDGIALGQTLHGLASGALPMLIVVTGLGLFYARDLSFALFCQTLAFVAFNKVCTAQYFVWWFMLLPLLIPALKRSEHRFKLCAAACFWIITQLHWLAWAYQLEFKAAEVYFQLWCASLVFFIANIVLLLSFIDVYTASPLFSKGKLLKTTKLA